MKTLILAIFLSLIPTAKAQYDGVQKYLDSGNYPKAIQTLLSKGTVFLNKNPRYYESLATLYSFNGEEKRALEYMDKWYASSGYPPRDNLVSIPNNLLIVDAAKHISEISKNFYFLLINEAHHVPKHRRFTQSLLRSLWKSGFRSLGLEGLQESDKVLNQRGHAIRGKSGFYFHNKDLIEMVNEALEIGYYVFSYDHNPNCDPFTDPTKNCQNLREEDQAKNILQFSQSPRSKGKVLIHAGYGHIAKKGDAKWTPMAQRLGQMVNKKILCIDQTSWSQRFLKKYESPYYKKIEENYPLTHDSVIFMSGISPYVPVEVDGIYDILVYHSRR